MAKKLKEYYDNDYAILIADKLQSSINDGDLKIKFDDNSFLNWTSEQICDQEFLSRQDTFADGFNKYITGTYTDKLALFESILGPVLAQETGMFTEGWWLWPVGRFVQKYNEAESLSSTLDFIYEFTQRHTGEFAIRPLLETNTKQVMQRMLLWSTDPSVHVRRLSSEGIRISLPWANKTTTPLNEFELYSQILTNLRHDSSKFVQKSVGNVLNDLMKHDRDLANQIIDQWESGESSKAMEWIITHGRRSLKSKTL